MKVGHRDNRTGEEEGVEGLEAKVRVKNRFKRNVEGWRKVWKDRKLSDQRGEC